jgi:hypothetical protein
MLTSELTGAVLDWAVAKCEGGDGLWHDTIATHWIKIDGKDRALSKGWSKAQSFTPSTDWVDGGLIIERESISITSATFPWWSCDSGWYSHMGDYYAHGSTPLIAAMRCYVKSKLGDEVDVPKELA